MNERPHSCEFSRREMLTRVSPWGTFSVSSKQAGWAQAHIRDPSNCTCMYRLPTPGPHTLFSRDDWGHTTRFKPFATTEAQLMLLLAWSGLAACGRDDVLVSHWPSQADRQRLLPRRPRGAGRMGRRHAATLAVVNIPIQAPSSRRMFASYISRICLLRLGKSVLRPCKKPGKRL